MEGFRDLYWSGDRTAWENLFRHYLRCLNWSHSGETLTGCGSTREPLQFSPTGRMSASTGYL